MCALMEGQSSVFVTTESVYNIDGTVAPIRAMVDAMDEIFPARNAHMVVDEAHATGIYGWSRHGRTAWVGEPCACPVAHLRQGPRKRPVVCSFSDY